jgi:hypothetical protein
MWWEVRRNEIRIERVVKKTSVADYFSVPRSPKQPLNGVLMDVFGVSDDLDPRFMWRLTGMVRIGGASSFATGGEALATAVLSGEELPDWAEQMAEDMAFSLVRMTDVDDPVLRLRAAMGTIVLSLVRPRLARRCDCALARLLAKGLGDPEELGNTATLVARALLALYADDLWEAKRSVKLLGKSGVHGTAWALQDWISARENGGNEERCFDHLRIVITRSGTSPIAPALLLLASLVLCDHAGMTRDGVVGWLKEVNWESSGWVVASHG